MAGNMGLFVWSLVGGVVGTGLMDVAARVAKGLKIISGGS